MKKDQISAEYLHRLQLCYHYIERRGIAVNLKRLEEARTFIDSEIDKQCKIIGAMWGCHVYVGADNDDGSDGSVNLNASSGKRTPLLKLKELGYEIPKISARDEDGNYIAKESLGELVLQKMFSTNQMGIQGGDPSILAILRVREVVTIKNRYLNANLYNQDGIPVYLSGYKATGTVTGRRSSGIHVFGYGGNAQNFTKHGELARIHRRCLVARPGKIFLMVDQISAEDWPVSALAQNTNALNELQTGVDRHMMLACAIFNLTPDSKTKKEWKESLERYLGKKVRHANNYDMQKNTMSDSLAKEGLSYPPSACQFVLDRANAADPSIKGVFHEYIRQCLYRLRLLKTPFGRERQFFGLRSGDAGSNGKIFREAYSYIPQSCVGDNTGFAVFELETKGGMETKNAGTIVQEGHDSIIQEIDCSVEAIWDSIQRTIKAFKRVIRFDNNIEIEIPVEGEIGFDFYHTETLKSAKGSNRLTDISYQDIQRHFYALRTYQESELEKEAHAP